MDLARGWRNDYRVWRWCRQRNPISDFEQARWFDAQSKDPTIQMFKIMASGDGKSNAVGVCGFTSIDWPNRRAEFSLYVDARLQGQGFGRGALHCLLTQGFDNLGFHVIWGETFEGNPAEHLFAKMGFVKEGTRRDFYFKEGKFMDAHLYSIKETEWRAHLSDSSK